MSGARSQPLCILLHRDQAFCSETQFHCPVRHVKGEGRGGEGRGGEGREGGKEEGRGGKEGRKRGGEGRNGKSGKGRGNGLGQQVSQWYIGKPIYTYVYIMYLHTFMHVHTILQFTEDCCEVQITYTEDSHQTLPAHLQYMYSHFRFFSPSCTLHTTITHTISVLERWRLTHDYTIGIHVRLRRSNTFIMCVIAVCNV